MEGFRYFLDDFLDKTVLFGYDRIGYFIRRPLWEPLETEASMKGTRCIITGANSGLGRATAHLKQRSYDGVLVYSKDGKGSLYAEVKYRDLDGKVIATKKTERYLFFYE